MTAQFDLSAALHGAPDGASWMAGTSPAMTQVGTFEQHDVVATNGRARSLALRRPPHRRRLTPSWPGLTRPSTPAPQGARRGRGPERLSFARSSPTRVVDGNDHLGMPMPFAPLPRHPPIKTPPNRPRPTPGRASPRRAPHAVESTWSSWRPLGKAMLEGVESGGRHRRGQKIFDPHAAKRAKR